MRDAVLLFVPPHEYIYFHVVLVETLPFSLQCYEVYAAIFFSRALCIGAGI